MWCYVTVLVGVLKMEDIGLFKQGWKWLQSKRHCCAGSRTSVMGFRDKFWIFVEVQWPVVCGGCARLGGVLLWLLIYWRDCVVRGIRSIIKMGSAALLIIMWSSFLSLTSMSCLVYVLMGMVSFEIEFSSIFLVSEWSERL